jgi:ABC-type multidrug transport system, ATPase component
MNALEINNLSKRFDNFFLDDINLTLPQGYILGYIGRNGAGKTTTIKLILELLKKDNGDIKVFDMKYNGNEEKYKDAIGYIADDFYFPESFTLKELCVVLKSFYESFDEKKFKMYTDNWQLPQNKKVGYYSNGMKTKLMFAIALSRDTKLLILDEPTTGLDPVIHEEVLDLLQEYITDGMHSVLFSTHVMTDLERIADYICFIDNGRIIYNDTKDNLIGNFLLVKGNKWDIPPELKTRIIGMKNTDVGFTGLIYAKDRQYFEERTFLERPTINDIFIFTINNSKR